MTEWTKEDKEVIPLPHKIEFSELSEYDDWRAVLYEIEKARLYLDYLENSYEIERDIEEYSLVEELSKPREIQGPEFSH